MTQRNVRRELLTIALISLGVFVFAFVTGISEGLLRPFTTTLPLRGAVIFAFLALVIGSVVFGVRRWRQAETTQQQISTLFENVPVGMFRTTSDGRFVMANPALAHMLGFESPHELMEHYQDINRQLYVYPERRTEYLDNLARDGVVRDFENLVYRKDGSQIWVLGNGRAETDAHGKILYIEGNVQDITARRETEVAYRRLVDYSLQGIAILQKGRFVFSNAAFAEMVGLTSPEVEALEPAQVAALVHSDDRDALFGRIRDRLQGKNVPSQQIFQTLRRDNKIRWLEANVSRIEYQNAPAVFILAVDVTERKAAQDAMQVNLQRTHLREEVSSTLARGGTDLPAVVRNLTRVLAGNVGDACVVALLSADGKWSEIAAYAHNDPMRYATMQQVLKDVRVPVNHTTLGNLIDRGEAVLVVNLNPERIKMLNLGAYAAYMETAEVHSLLVVPMRNGGQVVGLLTVTREGAREPFGADDQALVQELADRAALAVANAQLVGQLQAELEARRHAEEKYRTLVEQIPAITYIASSDRIGDTLYVSPQVQTTLGFTADEWLSARDFWTTRLHPDDSARVLEQEALARRAHLPFHAEYRLIARDGSVHWVRDEAVLVYDDAARPLYQHGIMLDITASKTLELKYGHALKQSDAERAALRRELADGRAQTAQPIVVEPSQTNLLRAFVESSLDLLVALAADGTILYVNSTVLERYGYTPEELIGNSFQSYIHPDDFGLMGAQLQHLMQAPETIQNFQSIRTRTKMGEWRLVEGIAVSRLNDPEIQAILFNVRDVTAQALHQNTAPQAQAAERAQAAFAQALGEAAALLNSASDVDQVLDGILDTVARIVPYETASIFMRDGPVLRMARARGFEKYGLQDWIRQVTFSTDMAKYQQLIANPGPLTISDTQTYEGWVVLPETLWIRSNLAVPVRMGDETVGLLGLDSQHPNFYTPEHGARLLAFADLAGAALRNARLLDETRQRAHEFRALYETMSELSVPGETSPVLETVVARAQALFKAPIGVLYTYQAGDTQLRLAVNFGLDASYVARLKFGEGLIGQVALTRQPQFVNDYQGWVGHVSEAVDQNIRAAIAVPIAYGGTLNGVLGIAETDPAIKYNQKQLDLLTLFAGQVGAAVETSRLLSETRKRAEQLSLLYDVGLTLNRVLDSQTQLDFIFKIALRALTADSMTYFRYQSQTETLVYEMSAGVPEDVVAQLRAHALSLQRSQDVVSWVARERVPVLVPDVARETRWQFTEPLPGSVLGVPVEHNQDLRGVLLAMRYTREPFTPLDERMLILFANQIAAAMELTGLFQAQVKRQHELEILRQASLAFASTPERDTLTTLILQYALRLVAADNALLFFYAEDVLTFGALLWNTKGSMTPTHWTPRENGFTYTVARTGQPLIVDQVNAHPIFTTWQWGGAIVGLPLHGGGRVRAVLNISFEAPHRFTPEELRVLELLADQAAVALENARNYGEIQRQLRDAQILHRAGEALNRTLSFEETLEHLADSFLEAFDVQMVSMSRFHLERDEIEVLLDRDPRPGSVAVPGSVYRISEHPYLMDLLREKKAVTLRRDDPNLLPENARLMDLYFWRAVLALPLFIGDRVIGYVELADQLMCRDFSPEAIRLGESLAHQAASALHNAQLFQETQRRAEHLAVLNHIARRVNSAATLDEMLTVIESETATVVPSDASYVALYDDRTEMVDFHRVVDYGVPRPAFQQQLSPSLTRLVITTARAVRLDDRTAYKSEENPLQFYGDGSVLHSWLGVPIRSGDRVLGVISLQAIKPAAFGEADEQLLQTIADQVAAPIERALRST